MLFNSYEFLFAFLPVTLVVYYLLGGLARTAWLVAASYLFYGWWDYRFCGLLLLSTVIDYIAGGRIYCETRPSRKRVWLALSVVTNLSLLGFFKYFDLFAETINAGAVLLTGVDDFRLPLLNLVLPVGISFYTFQSMSYSIDIYRGHARPARSFLEFACYVSLFPQLVAGPIIRYGMIADQMVKRSHTLEKFALGLAFFICGLAKKVVLADGAAQLVPMAFDRTDVPTFWGAWLGVLGYSMQIYFDFSGYSDMAIGLGLMMGFVFPQNFNSPYKAASISEFWRRWHISLSTWLRDYLYIPLGGNRISERRTYINLMTVMLLGGLWHGANWTFVLWGGYHGILLAAERRLGLAKGASPTVWKRAVTFLLVVLGWVIFRSESPAEAARIVGAMCGAFGWGHPVDPLQEVGFIGIAVFTLCMVLAFLGPNTWEIRWRFSALEAVGLLLLFLLSLGVLLVNASSPFLYFQF